MAARLIRHHRGTRRQVEEEEDPRLERPDTSGVPGVARDIDEDIGYFLISFICFILGFCCFDFILSFPCPFFGTSVRSGKQKRDRARRQPNEAVTGVRAMGYYRVRNTE